MKTIHFCTVIPLLTDVEGASNLENQSTILIGKRFFEINSEILVVQYMSKILPCGCFLYPNQLLFSVTERTGTKHEHKLI